MILFKTSSVFLLSGFALGKKNAFNMIAIYKKIVLEKTWKF